MASGFLRPAPGKPGFLASGTKQAGQAGGPAGRGGWRRTRL